MRRQELQGNVALELGILGPIDHTHPTSPNLLDDRIVRYPSSGSKYLE
jgi:hypothetical protein